MKTKSILLEFEGKDYTLQYTRRVVEGMERRGFRINELVDCPATQIPLLVHGAFQMHHKHVQPEKAMKIYNTLPNRDEFLGKLVELYQEPIRSLMESPEDLEGDTEGNGTTWTADF